MSLELTDMMLDVEKSFRATLHPSAKYPADRPARIPELSTWSLKARVGDDPDPADFWIRYGDPAGQALARLASRGGCTNFSRLSGEFVQEDGTRHLLVVAEGWK